MRSPVMVMAPACIEKSRRDERIAPIGSDMRRDTVYPPPPYTVGYIHGRNDLLTDILTCYICLAFLRA